MTDALLQQGDTGLDLVQLQVLVGLVGAVDRARPHDDGFHAKLLQEWRFGGEGHGLGLAGALILARCLGGDINIVSQKGQGATFRLTLPLKLESGQG